jgi:hypothetical protein
MQIGGAALAFGEHQGLQIAAATFAKDIDGAQIGIVNMGKHVKGLQVGVVNHADSLRGVQIGLVNHAEEGGVLPWTGVLNIGFGEGDEDPSFSRRSVARR